MRRPIFIREVTPAEQQAIEAGLRAPSSFTMRRCQILLASQRGLHAQQIADQLACDDQTVRNALKAFNQHGCAALQPGDSTPKHLPRAVFDDQRRAQLRDLLHQSPRTFGEPTSNWTLALAAKVAYAQGITPRLVSDETIRVALKALNVRWQRAKHWITSPDPAYMRKKSNGTG